ncbi:unnamed protein product [Didymodactylos carnosus]|uniref:Uncharacterized protein n=1 Tax=Didymodactylos carnosus TaxID=1234261 RepID=A0A813P7I6_9BILA|nr:unnamed protein product [Didymodactylos carnosus]CAF1001552.1 unnamed protein product [Didymodactylos carnosus]CAF3529557.1 unnamed protein product [Didymodactylos carnosus]CAF3770928.1 unnamed protein product [Didymodactylos carnosus]
MLTTNDICKTTFKKFGYSKQFPLVSNYTCLEWKTKLSQLRIKREQELEHRVNECYRLRDLHKNQFDCCITANKQKVSEPLSTTTMINDDHQEKSQDVLFEKKHSILRIKYCPLLYTLDTNISTHQETFVPEKYDKLVKNEKELSILKDLTQHIPSTSEQDRENTNVPSTQLVNKQMKSSDVTTKRLSVSSVNTADKRRCIVYEEWPNIEQISKILGYKIQQKSMTPAVVEKKSSSPLVTGRSKRHALTSAAKRLKRETNPPLSRNDPPTLSSLAVLGSSPVVMNNLQMKPDKIKLPDIFCPSSESYSTTILIKRWLMKNDFCSGSSRTLPLL